MRPIRVLTVRHTGNKSIDLKAEYFSTFRSNSLPATMGWFGKKAEGKRQAATTERLAATVGSYNHPPLESVVPAASNYVAPNILLPPASPAQSSVVAQSTVVSQKLLDIDDEEMVVVDKHQVDKHHVDKHQVDKDEDFEDDYDEIENPTSTSYSRAGDSDPEPRANYGSDSKQTHLNSLFNGHLMKWKYEAEEGTAFLRVPACKCPPDGKWGGRYCTASMTIT